MLKPKTLDSISVQMRSSFLKMLETSNTMDTQNAIDMFREIVKADPEFIEARKRLRELELSNIDNVNSQKALVNSITFPIILGLKKAFAKKNINSMLESCEDALAINLKNVSVLTKMAEVAILDGGYFIAVEALEFAYQFKPKDKLIMMKLGDAYIKNMEAAKSVELYRNYLKEKPNDQKVKTAFKQAGLEMQIQSDSMSNNPNSNLDDAAKAAAEQKAKDLENAVLQQILEGTIRDEEQANLVIAKLKPVVDKTKSLDALRKLAEAYKVSQRYDEAIECLNVVASSLGTLDAKLDKDIEKLEVLKLNQQLNTIVDNKSQYENADELIEQLENSIIELRIFKAQNRSKHFINDVHLHYELAVEYFNAGYLDEAYQEFDISKKNAQHKGNCLYYMARIALVDGDVDKAYPLLISAHQNLGIKDRNYKPATYYAGLLYENNGEMDKASEMYQIVYNLDANYKDVASKLKK